MRTRTLAISLLLLTSALMCAAWSAGSGPRAATGRAAPMGIRQLGLSQEQARHVRDIVGELRSDVKAVAALDIPKQDKLARVKAARQAAGEAIMAVLTPDQRAKAGQLSLSRGLLSPRKHRAGMKLALRRLDLADQQKADIKAILADARDLAKAIKQDTSLDVAARKARLRDLRQDTMTRLKSVLTAEQLQKLEKQRKFRCWRGRGPGEPPSGS